jgi:hypothetical protein
MLEARLSAMRRGAGDLLDVIQGPTPAPSATEKSDGVDLKGILRRTMGIADELGETLQTIAVVIGTPEEHLQKAEPGTVVMRERM